MRLRPGLTVLWRTATQVQVGTDPRWAVVLADLSPGAARALTGLRPGADVRVVRCRLQDAGVPPEEESRVVEHLVAARLLLPVEASRPVSPDDVGWGLLRGDGDPAPLMRDRDRAHVRVEGLGRLGLLTAATLAAAGVGTVQTVDPRPVTTADLATPGLTAADLGEVRAAVAARVLHDVAPTVRTTAHPHHVPDLVVLVEHHATDPVRHRCLVRDDVPHLSLVVREASTLVGPLVRPGTDPCLRCLDLHRADRDDRWPAVGPQLLATGPAVAGGEEAGLAMTAAGLAAAQVLAHVDGRPTTVAGAAWEVRLPDGVPRRTAWDVHPDCGCAGVPGSAPSAPVSGRAEVPALVDGDLG